jgi:integrase
LTAVNETAVTKWLGTLKGSGKTVANKHGFLAGALNAAVRKGVLGANPCIHSRLPKTQREEMVFLSPADFRAIHDKLTADWRPLATWLVCSGMRFSEATALRVGDIDTKANTVRITRAWKYTADGSERIGPPKSKAGTRTIDVPPEAIAVLDLKRPRGELLFANSKGKRIRSTVFF